MSVGSDLGLPWANGLCHSVSACGDNLESEVERQQMVKVCILMDEEGVSPLPNLGSVPQCECPGPLRNPPHNLSMEPSEP